jgi:predicted amidophosphoribosyltransferase
VTCLACRGASRDAVCAGCRRTLRPAPDRVVGTVLVRSAFEHEGAARALVHRLKYEAVSGVALRLATVMAPLLPTRATAVVPVPRARVRHLLYGIDPAGALARALGRVADLPVEDRLVPPAWARRRAGGADRDRGARSFRLVGTVPRGAVLVDDVVTTGTTLLAAAAATGLGHAVTATSSWHSALTSRRGAP